MAVFNVVFIVVVSILSLVNFFMNISKGEDNNPDTC